MPHHPRVRLPRMLAVPVAIGLLLTGAVVAGGSTPAAATPVSAQAAVALPSVRISLVSRSLNVPWDVTWVGSTMLIDERGGKLWTKRPPRARERVKITFPRLWTASEGGLMGMVADPKASTNKLFYVCAATKSRRGNPVDVRVLRYRLDSPTKATAVGKPVITGLPLTTGRHAGCRLRFGADQKLYVGTGDAAQGRNPQNKQSLGGKVLRVNSNGTIPADNPYVKLGGKARYVWNYGHRNVQGLALRPGTRELWSVEQGTGRDDEINRVWKGDNYGYNPVPGYNESVPMTDTRTYPGAIRARWRSGPTTLATCGATFLTGKSWGRWNGALAVGALKAQQIRLFRLDASGHVIQSTQLTAVRKGRIRTVQSGPGGSLYFTTSNGIHDSVYKITPR